MCLCKVDRAGLTLAALFRLADTGKGPSVSKSAKGNICPGKAAPDSGDGFLDFDEVRAEPPQSTLESSNENPFSSMYVSFSYVSCPTVLIDRLGPCARRRKVRALVRGPLGIGTDRLSEGDLKDIWKVKARAPTGLSPLSRCSGAHPDAAGPTQVPALVDWNIPGSPLQYQT